jgi:2-methylcitrate dehydratase PrpD
MILRRWAERLLHETASPDVIELHIKDVVAAFLTGLRTNDGQAIARRLKEGTDGVDLAASISAIARLSESDDIDLIGCVTPGSIVIPVALANNRNRNNFNGAVAAGYSAGLLLGNMIGGADALARGIWPTLFVAPVMAAVTATLLTTRDPEQLAHALALALLSADGRVGSPAERWAILADAVGRGLSAAEAAGKDARGDLDFLPEGVYLTPFAGRLGVALDGIAQVGFKPFPIARQGANAVVAFQRMLAKGIDPHQIDAVDVFVPAINTKLLSRSASETDRLSRLCGMGLQLAAAAYAPSLLYDPERPLRSDLIEFSRRVSVSAGRDLEDTWPYRWPARVVVRLGTKRVEETIVQAPFDFDAPGLPELLQEKWRRMLPAQDLTLLNHGQPGGPPYATLWRQIERRLRMPAED